MLRNITSLVALLAVMVLSAVNGLAQAPLNRSVAITAGTYAEITGGTVIWNNTTQVWAYSSDVQVALPFNVVYAGSTYNDVWVNGGGSISFGSSNNALTPLQNGRPCVSAFGNALTSAGGGDVSYVVTGVAPNRTLTIQWRNATRYYGDNIARDVYNFQIRVSEANTTVNGSRIDVVYGPMTVNAPIVAQVGATNGSSQTLGVYVDNYVASWARPHFMNTAMNATMSQTVVPSNGATITFREVVAPAHNNDVGVRTTTNQYVKFTTGQAQTIQAVVRNWGSNNIDSLVIDWSINGAAQTPVKYYPQPALAPGQERVVTLGDRTFAPLSMNTISVATSLPNGVADVNPGNDRFVTEMAPRVSGTVVVGQNGNPNVFQSINAAMRHISVAGLSNDLTVELLAGTYTEEVIVPAIDAAAGRVTITKRGGDNVVITETLYPAFANYDGSENHSVVQIDGGSSKITFRGLKMVVNNASRFASLVYSENAADVIFEGCTFVGPDSYATLTNYYPGVYLANYATTSQNVVIGCTFNNLPEALTIDVINGTNLVSTNKLENVIYGINAYGGSPRILNNSILTCDCNGNVQALTVGGTTDADVMGNKVNAILTTGSAFGIYGYSNNRSEVTNNMVTVGGSSTAYGLLVELNAGTDNWLFHNSVNVTGSAPAAQSTALYVWNGGGKLYGANNIFHNFGTGSNAGYAAWFTSATPNPFATWDFNNLMTTGANVVNWGGTLVPRNAGANPLASWRAGSGRDQNSSSVAVNFVGATDLHLQTIQRELFGSSVVLSIVKDDIDGSVRTKPYMGAHEIMPQISIVRQPASAYVCVGSVDTLIAIADVTAGAATTYQWFKDGVELTGQTGNIMVINNAQYTTAGVYTCLVKANDGTNFIQLSTEGATVMVVRPTQITDQPTSQPVADGGSFNLSISAEAIGAPTNFVPGYQWMKRAWNELTTSYEDTPINDDGRITGSQSSMLTVRNAGAADTAGTYVCQVTGYCGTVTSKAARVFIPLVAVSNMTPNLCEGGTLNLDLRANPTRLPEGNATFQWLKNGVEIKGAVAPALEVKNFGKSDNGTYTCVMTFGSKELTFTSNEVTVTAGTAPEFTRQPEGMTICEGKVITLSAGAAGDNVQFQWMKGTQVLANETASTLSRLATDADAGSYSVVITNTCGTKTSTAVDVVVDPLAKISTQPSDVQFTQGGKITMSVVAAGRNIYNYQWYVNDVAIPGATNATLEINNATTANAGTYYCEVTNLCGAVKTRNAVASITTGVTEDVVAGGYLLSTAFPNPTFDASNVTFAVPAAQQVRVTVSDLMGRELGVLVNEVVESGSHVIKFRASEFNLTAGAYNVTMNAGGFVATQQVVVVK
jgi:hypothetical protein